MVLIHWPDKIEHVETRSWGTHRELKIPQFQKWFIICSAGNSILENIVNRSTQNLQNYKPFIQGVGKIGVLRTIDPIAFSKAILESPDFAKVRISSNYELGFVYSILGMNEQKNVSNNRDHYTNLAYPIICQNKFADFLVRVIYSPNK